MDATNGAVVKPGAIAVSISACGFVASAFEMIVCWLAREAGSEWPEPCFTWIFVKMKKANID